MSPASHDHTPTCASNKPPNTTPVDTEQVTAEREVPSLGFMGGLRIPLPTRLKTVEADLVAYRKEV
jgi:hypothetical protein